MAFPSNKAVNLSASYTGKLHEKFLHTYAAALTVSARAMPRANSDILVDLARAKTTSGL